MKRQSPNSISSSMSSLQTLHTPCRRGPQWLFHGKARWIAKGLLLSIALFIFALLLVGFPETHVQASPPPAPTRFAIIGDYGIAGQPEADVANLVKSWNPEFIVTVGDNNYELGEASTIDQNIGQYYHEYIYPYMGTYGAGATVNRFFPVLGDHDWGESLGNCQAYLDYFTLPGNERYYDFVWGPVHFFALDTDTHEPDGITSDSIQAQWLQNRLAAATEPWKIVLSPEAPYTSSLNQEYTATFARWPFKAWGATTVISGDFHAYERLIVDGLPYLVNGRGGSPFVTPFGRPFPGSKAQYLDDFGAMLVEASSETITFKFITRTGVLIDKFTIPTPTHTMYCSAPELGSGLLARWSAEETAADFIGQNDGVLTGGVTFAPGKVGEAFNFNGTTADVKVTDSLVLQSAFSALSLDAWVYPTVHGADTVPGFGLYGKTIISNTDADGFALRVLNGYLQADLRLTSTDLLYNFNTGPQSQLPLNAWSHVALTYDGSLVTAYLNGQMVASIPATGNIRNSQNSSSCTCIGNESIGSDCAIQESGFGWRGLIDEMEVTNRALDPSEVQGIYNAGTAGQCYSAFEAPEPTPTPSSGDCLPPPSGLVAWFSGDGNASDLSGNNNNGTAENSAIFVPGMVEEAFGFDGLLSTVSLPSSALHDGFSALTINAWVNPQSHGSDLIPGVGIFGRTIISITDSDGFALRIKDGFIQADLRLTGGDLLQTFNQTQLPLNSWSHVALTYDGSMVHAYLNGNELGSGVAASGTIRNILNASNCAMVGNEGDGCVVSNLSGQPAGFGWQGKIDEVQVFNRALTASEIQDIFSAGSAGVCKPSVATSTSVTSSVNPSNFGQSVTFTANLSAVGSPTGTVQFKANGSPIGGPVTLVGNSASVSTSTLAAGTYTITAEYSGDSGFLPSTGTLPAAQIVNAAATTSTSVTSSVNPSNFGQSVTFTANINASGSPTGTVQFKANGSPIGGPATVVNKSAAVSTSTLAVGTYTITAVYSGGGGFLGSTGTLAGTQRVNPAPTTSAVTVSPNPVQYSDRVNFVATLTPANINGLAPAASATFKVGTQTMGTATLVPVGGQLRATLSNVQVLSAPGAYTATAQFNGLNSSFVVSNPTTTFNVTPEDARVTYSGLTFVSTTTSTATTAAVTLRATVQDITATSDAAGDTSFGDVRNAKVTFVITNAITSATVATISNVPVSLVNSSDTKTGTATYNWTANLGSAIAVMYQVHMVVSNYYTRESSEDDELLTVAKLGTNFVAGAGYLLETNSAGLLAADIGSKCKFGFVVKSTTVNGKAVLTGMGGMIVRRGGHVYFFIGSSLTSLVSNVSTGKATLGGKFIILDITDRRHLSIVDLNATFQITLTDKGAPGSLDTIGFTVWKPNNQLYFSSKWNGATTIEQLLGGGNLLVR